MVSAFDGLYNMNLIAAVPRIAHLLIKSSTTVIF